MALRLKEGQVEERAIPCVIQLTPPAAARRLQCAPAALGQPITADWARRPLSNSLLLLLLTSTSSSSGTSIQANINSAATDDRPVVHPSHYYCARGRRQRSSAQQNGLHQEAVVVGMPASGVVLRWRRGVRPAAADGRGPELNGGEATETRRLRQTTSAHGTVNGGRTLIPVYAAQSAVSYLFWSLYVGCVSKTEKPTPPFRRTPFSLRP
jgi:hypothetical protein